MAGTTHGKTLGELEVDGLSLGNRRESAVADVLSEESDRTLREAPTRLDETSELADAATLLTEDVLSAGGADNNLGKDGGAANLDTGVAVGTEGAGEELIEFGVENTVCDKLALLGDGHITMKEKKVG